MFDAIQQANAKGVLFIAAAGNNATNNEQTPEYPASYKLPNVVSVAATGGTDKLTNFSNYGATSVHLAAPGYSILSTFLQNQYGYLSGTSMAAPHVSAAAALLKSAYPALTAAQLKDLLLSSVDTFDALKNKVVSAGRLNVARAFELAKVRFGEPVKE